MNTFNNIHFINLVIFSLILHVSLAHIFLNTDCEWLLFLNFQMIHVHGSAKFSGCDFDLLEQNPSIIEYLSDECKTLSADKTSDEYKLLLQEAHSYANFQLKLSEYERRKNPNTNPSDGIPQKQWAFRNEIYRKNHFFQCIKPNTALKDIMNCVINLRKNMSDSIVL